MGKRTHIHVSVPALQSPQHSQGLNPRPPTPKSNTISTKPKRALIIPISFILKIL